MNQFSKQHSARRKGVETITKAQYKSYNKKTKYGAKKVKSNGKTYDSGLEKCVANELEFRKKAKEITFIQEQFPVTHYLNGHKIGKNIIDFKCDLPDGRIMFVEAKGAETPRFRILKQMHIANLDKLYPDCEYWLVKGSCSRLIWLQIKLVKSA